MFSCCRPSRQVLPDEPAAPVPDQAVQRALEEEALRARDIMKLLLIGPGDSGKSTLFKQTNVVYGTGFTDAERAAFVGEVYNSILSALIALVDACDTLDADLDAKIRPEAVAARDLLKGVPIGTRIDRRVCDAIRTLWADPGLQNAYAHRSRFQLHDSTAYFMERLGDVSADGYVPTQQDILRVRASTTGILERDFSVQGRTFRILDVGGQRTERKKWIRCFEGVSAVIFVASLADYDLMLYEDETVNRMAEALNLFGEICRLPYFRNTPIILILNKKDVFKQKLADSSLANLFPEYAGGADYEAGVRFVQERFLAKLPAGLSVEPFVTCACEVDNVRLVLDRVIDLIVSKASAPVVIAPGAATTTTL
ncbi:G-protein alpha subunit [Plasmodiophora brassicae]